MQAEWSAGLQPTFDRTMRKAVRFGWELPTFRGGGLDAVEWIAINQLLDRRMIATDRAEWFRATSSPFHFAPELLRSVNETVRPHNFP